MTKRNIATELLTNFLPPSSSSASPTQPSSLAIAYVAVCTYIHCEQARKSLEDTHFTGCTRFEKVFGLCKLWVTKVFGKKTLKKYTLKKYTFVKYTFGKYTFKKYTFGKYTFGKYTFGKYTKIIGVLSLQLFT